MGASEILLAIDSEIAQLQKARAVLVGSTAAKKVVSPAKKTAAVAPAKAKPTKKRKLTPEGRKRIAEAVKKRWAAQKAAAGK
ncbi:MAG: hypothetical protein P4K86_11125 [Terracidiphilus sp.]|nr:hypothetical protein [Terracidiphilus sp.]MDR3776590.1 hypothetical protein [Terracidiphilus sp.]